MSDNVSISYSYQAGDEKPPQAAPAEQGELFAYIGVRLVPLGQGKVLLINERSGGQMVTAQRVADKLPGCTAFRTLEGHARAICATSPELNDPAKVVGALQMLRDADVLTSADSICQRLAGDSAGTAAVAPTRVFVITCDRPEAVERLLDSMLRAGNLSAHEELFLVDDSRDGDRAERNRSAVENFNLTSSREICYFGRPQQEAFVQALVEELPEHERGIRFLIDAAEWRDQWSAGLARTLCTLLSVGRRAVVVDDDVLCSAVHSPVQEAGVSISDAVREAAFYASPQDIQARTRRAEFDPLSATARCLGMSVGQAVRELTGADLEAQSLRDTNGLLLSHWDGDSPVVLTQCGFLGDPGTRDCHWMALLEGASAERLRETPGGWEGAVHNRQCWTGRTRPTFSRMAIQSGITGLDNTHLLPPYFPAYRGRSLMFGAMVEHLHPHSAVLEYDWCVPHLPLQQRDQQTSPPIPSGRGMISLEKLINSCTQYTAGLTPELRLERLEWLLREKAEISDPGLQMIFRQEVAEQQRLQGAVLAERLADGLAGPQPWVDYLRQARANLQQAMNEAAKLTDIPHLPGTLSEDQVLAEFRKLARGFADGLRAWPAMREASQRTCEAFLAAGRLNP